MCACTLPCTLPFTFLQLRSMPLFSIKDHPNTLAAGGTNDTHHLWVLLHNLGEVCCNMSTVQYSSSQRSDSHM